MPSSLLVSLSTFKTRKEDSGYGVFKKDQERTDVMSKNLFSLNGTKKGCKMHAERVRSIVSAMFESSRSDDKVWDQWLNLNRESSGGLSGLIASNVREAFKARAIAISLSPAIQYMPFEWNERPVFGNYLSLWETIDFSDLSPRLRYLALKLIEVNVEEILNDSSDEFRASLVYYNRIIIKTLTFLPEDDPGAFKLFQYYQLNDPVSFWGIEESSGYNPFLIIICSQVSEKWKAAADGRMREIIELEEKGYLESRCEWERALKCYVSHIQIGACIGRIPYNLDLFASQLTFMLDKDTEGTSISFDRWHVRSILTLLRDDKYHEICRRFARHTVFSGRFEVICDATMISAEQMLSLFGEKDKELRDHLNRLIVEGKKQILKREEADRAEKEKVSSVISMMI